MASWSDVTAAAPDLAADVQARFEAHGLAFLATLRKDGSPRISGLETFFGAGELWLGMMDGARKLADLRRDPRFALHAATADKEVKDGDAKLSGIARWVDDDATFATFTEAARAVHDHMPEGRFPLFRADVLEISHLRPNGDHLVIRWWREGAPPQEVKRY